MYIVYYNRVNQQRQIRIGSVICSVPSPMRAFDPDINQTMDTPFAVVENDAQAKHVAEKMAQSCPSVEVCIAELKFQFQAKTPEVVCKEVSSKGVLPA